MKDDVELQTIVTNYHRVFDKLLDMTRNLDEMKDTDPKLLADIEIWLDSKEMSTKFLRRGVELFHEYSKVLYSKGIISKEQFDFHMKARMG